jgi:hypothetical protein
LLSSALREYERMSPAGDSFADSTFAEIEDLSLPQREKLKATHIRLLQSIQSDMIRLEHSTEQLVRRSAHDLLMQAKMLSTIPLVVDMATEDLIRAGWLGAEYPIRRSTGHCQTCRSSLLRFNPTDGFLYCFYCGSESIGKPDRTM